MRSWHTVADFQRSGQRQLRASLRSARECLAGYPAGRSRAKKTVAAFLDSLERRTLDAGGLQAAPLLEQAGLLQMCLARNGAGVDLALGAEVR